ncbi:response regulator receiver domain protein [[Clostridium] hylemonae DSM 15053]|uniref:Stage 0 sporulation protein A homolog n=2 Tax=[Clostridium] hylemonae TaxID=89153 RepID=C0C095_9FIRM|nr:response regulator receiver domain protein [[Clostridium] hylemonae DSM 15053]
MILPCRRKEGNRMDDKGTVLLVEDDKAIMRTNRRILERDGFRVLCAQTLAQARTQLKSQPDVLVLDIMLPDGSGLDFCGEIRRHTAAPVLFLTALDEQHEVIKGLKSGGNDYITKPYSVDEFAARVSAQYDLARRVRQSAGREHLLTCGALELDVIAQRAYMSSQDMLLTQKEFALLMYLMQNRSKDTSPQLLYETVWRQPMADDDSAVKNTVYRLRKKLEGSGYTITTRRGEGYRFEEVL